MSASAKRKKENILIKLFKVAVAIPLFIFGLILFSTPNKETKTKKEIIDQDELQLKDETNLLWVSAWNKETDS